MKLGLAISSLLAAAMCGCGGSSGGDDSGQVFIALQRDFAGYASWMRHDLGAGAGGGVHLDGVRTVYLNQLAPGGSSEFPVGTVLVKTVSGGTSGETQIFAMAKRGGGYNSNGARGWEWFELLGDGSGTPLIVWRGITPPAGEGYGGGVVGGACNDCHAQAVANDFVASAALQLGALP